jgi:hypothetical protein
MALVLVGTQAMYLGLFSPASLRAEGINNWFGGGFLDSFWWSLKHVLDPGAFGENYGAPWQVVGLALLVSIGGVIVMGTLIGLISASIQQRFHRLERGNSTVVEANHVLILGWNQDVPGLALNLLRIHRGRSIVILAPRELEFMRAGLRSNGIDRKPDSIILRSGLPSRSEDLERVAVRDASAIVVVAHTRDEEHGADESDVEAIKTLLVLSRFEGWESTRPSEPITRGSRIASKRRPSIVCEITQKQNAEIAKIAGRGQVSLVSSRDFVSRLLVQASRQPGIAAVFDSILNSGGGGILVRSEPAAVGMTIDEITRSLRAAVPIGVAWTELQNGVERAAVALNPEPSDDVAEGERLVLLTRGEPVRLERTHTPPDTGRPDAATPRPDAHPDLASTSVLILGWSSMLDEILFELNGHSVGNTQVTVMSDLPLEEAERALASHSFPNLEVHLRRGDTVNRTTLAGLLTTEFDCVFALADETDGEDPDARTILTLLLLGDLHGPSGDTPEPRVVVELRDERNRELLAGSLAQDIVVSPDLVSIVMAQISLLPVLGPVYRELLSAGGIEIAVRPASRYAEIGEPISHARIVAAGQRVLEIVLGVRITSSGSEEVLLAPDLERRWVFEEGDSVIVLSQQVYR